MRLLTTLAVLLLISSAWAGTWHDDFEDGNLDGWKALVGERGRWSVINGELYGDGQANLDDFSAIGPAIQLDEYTLEVQVQGLSGVHCGISVQRQLDRTGSYPLNANTVDKVATGIWFGGGLLNAQSWLSNIGTVK